jgi:phosphate transport system substrate-binding protein
MAGIPACKRGEPVIVRIDGSSTVYPITEAIVEEYQRTNREARVAVGISGTGGGFKRLCAGDIDACDASRPIKPTEIDLCSRNGVAYVELPVAYDGIVVVVNPKNTWATSLTTAELARLWAPEAQGRVTRWNQVRADFPDREIHLFGAGVDSGTYDHFTEAIVGRQHASRGDYTSSEDDNVLVQGVAGDELALGFFGYVYYAENRTKLRALAIDDGRPENGDGPIAPSPETVRSGTYQPLARPVFVYVARRALDRQEVASFARAYLDLVPRMASEVGYVPLPVRAYTLDAERLAGRRTGTLFGAQGSAVGISIDALLAREQATIQP